MKTLKQLPPDSTTHGLSKDPTYISWSNMIQRCTNPKNAKYRRYGGRGINVCRKWLDFEGFIEDMGLRPPDRTIDRINNNKGYNKYNCRWATSKQQYLNKSKIYKIKYKSKIYTLKSFCKLHSIDYSRVMARISVDGYSVQRAIRNPFKRRKDSKITDEMIPTIKQWYQIEKLTPYKIAKRLGLNKRVVEYFCLEYLPKIHKLQNLQFEVIDEPKNF